MQVHDAQTAPPAPQPAAEDPRQRAAARLLAQNNGDLQELPGWAQRAVLERLRHAEPERYRQFAEKNSADACAWSANQKAEAASVQRLAQRDPQRAAAYCAHQQHAAAAIQADGEGGTWQRRSLEATEAKRAEAVLAPRSLRPASEVSRARWQQHVAHQQAALASIVESSQPDAVDRADVRANLRANEQALLVRESQPWMASLEPARRRQLVSRHEGDCRQLEQSGLTAAQSWNQCADALTFGTVTSSKSGDAGDMLQTAATLGGASLSRSAGEHLGRAAALDAQATQLEQLGAPDATRLHDMARDHAKAGGAEAGLLVVGTVGGVNPYAAAARGRLRGKLLDDAMQTSTTVSTSLADP